MSRNLTSVQKQAPSEPVDGLLVFGNRNERPVSVPASVQEPIPFPAKAPRAERAKRARDTASGPAVFRALIRCAVFAVLGLDALIIALYYAGFPRDNSGGRPTAEQPAPAQSILAVSVLLVVSALCGAFADLWYAARFKKAAPLAGCAGYLILAVLGIALTMAAGFIRSIAEGNLPAGAP